MGVCSYMGQRSVCWGEGLAFAHLFDEQVECAVV